MASFTLTGTIRDHEDQPVSRALVRAVPNPAVGVINGITYDSQTSYVYTNAQGMFTMTLVTYNGLYYSVDVSLGGTPIANTLNFAAPADGTSLDFSTVVSLPAVPNMTGTVSSQWVLDQIKPVQDQVTANSAQISANSTQITANANAIAALQTLQLGIAAAL